MAAKMYCVISVMFNFLVINEVEYQFNYNITGSHGDTVDTTVTFKW